MEGLHMGANITSLISERFNLRISAEEKKSRIEIVIFEKEEE